MKKTAWIVLLLLACSAVGSQAALAPPAAEPKVTLSFKQERVPTALASLFRQAGLVYRLEGVSADALQGTITSQLVETPLSAAVRLILREVKPPLVSRREADGVYVFTPRPSAVVVREPEPKVTAAPRAGVIVKCCG